MLNEVHNAWYSEGNEIRVDKKRLLLTMEKVCYDFNVADDSIKNSKVSMHFGQYKILLQYD